MTYEKYKEECIEWAKDYREEHGGDTAVNPPSFEDWLEQEGLK